MTSASSASSVIARFTDSHIVIQAPFSDLDTLRSVPGLAWNKAQKAWTGDLSPALAASLMRTFAGRLLCSDAQRLKSLAALAGEADRVRAAADLPDIMNARLTPWRHQKDEYWAMVRQPATLVYFGLGTGKTAPVVWYVQNMHVARTLVACPLSVISVWLSEFAKHATTPVTVWHKGELFPSSGILIVPLDKGSVGDKAAVLRAAWGYGGSVVVVCNYESCWRPPLSALLLGSNLDLLVMDEGHKLQAAGSRVSQYFHALGKHVAKRVALTGTPCPNGPLTVYGLYRALDSGIFGTSFARFRDEFAVMGGYQQHEVMGYKNTEEYNRRFYSIAVHADRSVLALKSFKTVNATLTVGGTAISAKKVTLNLNNALQDVGQTYGSALYKGEPIHGTREVTIDVELNYETAVDTIDSTNYQTDTVVASIVWVLESPSIITGTTPYRITITMNNVVIDGIERNVSGQAIIPARFTGLATAVSTTEPLTVAVIDAQAAAYSA
jgi:hypothetical protein